jgi:signal transduction histidine kinase
MGGERWESPSPSIASTAPEGHAPPEDAPSDDAAEAAQTGAAVTDAAVEAVEEPREPAVPAELLARLAHDIRSPLGLLSGALEELRADLHPSLDESHQRMFDLAERGLARLHRMAGVLQTAGELERGGVELDRVEMDLGDAVRGCVQALEKSDPRRNVEVEVDVPKGVVLPLDGPRVDEALRELVAQARRNARNQVKISVDDGDDAVVLRIEDDGLGWSKSRRQRAFDRLYQPEDRSGTGLGLSIARDLVRAHGGEVTIEDSSLPPGRPGTLGGAFVVTFPR